MITVEFYTMEQQIKEVTEKLINGTITKDDADKILLGLLSVINRRELLKHYSNYLYEKDYLTKPNVMMEYELSLL